MAVINILAYFELELITAVKILIVYVPRVKYYGFVIYGFQDQ
jgi:hypothetical protein